MTLLFFIPRYGTNNQVLCIINGILLARLYGMTPTMPEKLRTHHHLASTADDLATKSMITNCSDCVFYDRQPAVLFGPLDWYANVSRLNLTQQQCKGSPIDCFKRFHELHPDVNIAINVWLPNLFDLNEQKQLVLPEETTDCVGIHLRPFDKDLDNLTTDSDLSRFMFSPRSEQTLCNITVSAFLKQFSSKLIVAYPPKWEQGSELIRSVKATTGNSLLSDISMVASCSTIIGSHSTVMLSIRRKSKGTFIPIRDFC